MARHVFTSMAEATNTLNLWRSEGYLPRHKFLIYDTPTDFLAIFGYHPYCPICGNPRYIAEQWKRPDVTDQHWMNFCPKCSTYWTDPDEDNLSVTR